MEPSCYRMDDLIASDFDFVAAQAENRGAVVVYRMLASSMDFDKLKAEYDRWGNVRYMTSREYKRLPMLPPTDY